MTTKEYSDTFDKIWEEISEPMWEQFITAGEVIIPYEKLFDRLKDLKDEKKETRDT